jgi:hypothetical protein
VPYERPAHRGDRTGVQLFASEADSSYITGRSSLLGGERWRMALGVSELGALLARERVRHARE